MELLREKFIRKGTRSEVLSFASVSSLLQKKETKLEGLSILKNLNLDSIVKTEIFLSIFLIYLFPKDILEEENHRLYTLSENIIFREEINSLRESILDFFYLFKEWSGYSLTKLKEDLFQQYHNLTIEILNTEDRQRKEDFVKIQDSLLKSAKLIGYDIEILNYIYHSGNFEEEYNKVYLNRLENDIKEKNFSNLENYLEFLRNFFLIFFPKENNLFDISFIKQQFEHDCFDWEPFINNIYNLLLKIQSPGRDNDIKKNIELINEKDFLYHFNEIFKSIRFFIQDLENLKK